MMMMMYRRWFSVLVVFVFSVAEFASGIGEILFAVNAGGDTHVDVHGIRYERDPLHGKVGTASDYGKQLPIARVPPADQILYQTERYHLTSFGYTIPIHKDGDYVLVLKFCEVYFNSPGLKVFDVVVNDVITVVSELDIYERVGRGVAHDEYFGFSISGGKLRFNDEEIDYDGRIRVDFIKGSRDNPKVNAIYVMRGTLEDVPKLPTIPTDVEDDVFKGDVDERKPTKARNPSGPPHPDPYVMDESSAMLPIFVAIGAFIPILFCLCKL